MKIIINQSIIEKQYRRTVDSFILIHGENEASMGSIHSIFQCEQM